MNQLKGSRLLVLAENLAEPHRRNLFNALETLISISFINQVKERFGGNAGGQKVVALMENHAQQVCDIAKALIEKDKPCPIMLVLNTPDIV